MTDFDSMPIELLTKLVGEERTKLHASDAGTGLTHANDAAVLRQKAEIATRLNRMAFALNLRDALSSEDFAAIAGECRPYLTRATVPVMDSVRVS